MVDVGAVGVAAAKAAGSQLIKRGLPAEDDQRPLRRREVVMIFTSLAALLAGCVWVDADPPRQNTLVVDNRTDVDVQILTAARPGGVALSIATVPAQSKNRTEGGCLALELEARGPTGTVIATLPARRPDGCDPDDVWTITAQRP